MHSYYSDYYKPIALANTYEILMVPMPDKERWTTPKEVIEDIVLSSKYKRLPGRPRKGRKKKPGENARISCFCCGRCRHEGHNRRTCTFFPKKKVIF